MLYTNYSWKIMANPSRTPRKEKQHFCGDAKAVLGPVGKLGTVLRRLMALGECC